MATICGMLRLLTDDGAPFSNTAQSTFNEPSRASGSVASDLVDAAVVEDELGTDSVGDGATVEEELAEPNTEPELALVAMRDSLHVRSALCKAHKICLGKRLSRNLLSP